MADRVSALLGEYEVGRFDVDGGVGVTLCEVPNLVLGQVAAWPDTLAVAGASAAQAVGINSFPGPGRALSANGGSVLRIEPLKFWIVDAPVLPIASDQGATLDLSHSRTRIRISGPEATTLLNRHLPLDLRDSEFPVGSVGSTAFDHVGVTLWRSNAGYELFLPRGFALSLWELLLSGAAQFGYEVYRSDHA